MNEETHNFAWVVIVPTDDHVKSALLSGRMVKKTGTKATVVVLASGTITKGNIRALNSEFDLLIIPDTDKFAVETELENAAEQDLLLVCAMKSLGVFSRKIALAPGVVLQQNMDKFFQDDLDSGTQTLMTNETGLEWKIVMICEQPKTGNILPGKKADICDGLTCATDLEKYAEKEIIYVNEVIAGELLLKMGKGCMNGELGMGHCDTEDWVAVVGMACRFPKANSLEEYWDILYSGRNTRSTPPFNRTSLIDMDPEIVANFLKCPIDQFDSPFFGISPSAAAFTDPQARLLLEVSWEAFEEAQINPETLRFTKTGVFYGSWLQEYKEALTESNGVHSSSQDFLRKYIGNGFGCSAAKLSYFYGFTGPNIATE